MCRSWKSYDVGGRFNVTCSLFMSFVPLTLHGIKMTCAVLHMKHWIHIFMGLYAVIFPCLECLWHSIHFQQESEWLVSVQLFPFKYGRMVVHKYELGRICTWPRPCWDTCGIRLVGQKDVQNHNPVGSSSQDIDRRYKPWTSKHDTNFRNVPRMSTGCHMFLPKILLPSFQKYFSKNFNCQNLTYILIVHRASIFNLWSSKELNINFMSEFHPPSCHVSSTYLI